MSKVDAGTQTTEQPPDESKVEILARKLEEVKKEKAVLLAEVSCMIVMTVLHAEMRANAL